MIWSKPLREAPRWRNWQTRRSQKPMSARTSGFDSRSRHHAGVTAAAAWRVTASRSPRLPANAVSVAFHARVCRRTRGIAAGLWRGDDPRDHVRLDHGQDSHGAREDQAVADHAPEDVAFGANLVHARRTD